MYFKFKRIETEQDVDQAYGIYRSNEKYFQLVSGRAPSRQDVLNDQNSCPSEVELHQKKYGMYLLSCGEEIKDDDKIEVDDGPVPDCKNDRNDETHIDDFIAVVDVLEGFPNEKTYYIGLFLIDGSLHRAGLGRALYEQMEAEARRSGFEKIRLGVVDTNHKARAFWQTMGFDRVKTVESTLHERNDWTVEIMEKNL